MSRPLHRWLWPVRRAAEHFARRRAASVGLPPLLAFDLGAASFGEGVRAGFAVAAVVALNEWLHWPGLMETALAALLTCMCDAGGPVHRRLPALVSFGLIGASLTTAFSLLHPMPVWLVVPLTGLVVFACAFVRAFGASAMQVGNLLTVVLVLSLRDGAPGPDAALQAGATFVGGSLWALVLTMAIWRLHPSRPARQAVAACVHGMAVMVGDMRRVAATEADEARWDQHARAHRRRVREALEQAREAVLATVRTRGPAAGAAAQAWLRLEAADQLFGALIALSDLLAGSLSVAERTRADRLLRLLLAVLRVLERDILHEATRLRPGLERAIAAIPAVAEPPSEPAPAPEAAALRDLARIIAERLRATLSPSLGPDRLPVIPSPRWREVIAANLTRRSAVLRHALRASVVAMPGFAAMLIRPAPYLHWFTITLVVTLQPYVALTVVRAVERVGGTVVGGFAAAALSLVCTTPLTIAAALFPLSVLALTVRAVSFGLFMAALTPVVVLLSEIGQPGVSELHIALMRGLLTASGGATALLACLALWPAWEPQRLREQMRDALEAHGRYAVTVIDAILDDAEAAGAARADAARRAAGAASNAFEATLQRVLLERGLTLRSHAALDAMLTVDAALRRLVGRLSTLHLTRAELARDPAAWRAMRDWLMLATSRLAQGRADIPPRPAAAQGSADERRFRDGPLARLARPIELAAGAVARGEQVTQSG